MLGVHGNGLSHVLWLPPSRFLTVVEIFIPGGFAHDYEWTTRARGGKHFAIWNDTYVLCSSNRKMLLNADPQVSHIPQRSWRFLPGRVPRDEYPRPWPHCRKNDRRQTGRETLNDPSQSPRPIFVHPFMYICPILITCIFHPLAQMTQTISSTRHTLFSANCNERCLSFCSLCLLSVSRFCCHFWGRSLLT